MFRLLLCSIALALITPVTHGQDFDVDSYNVKITLNKEGYFDIVETYDINFLYHKHGIYRDILTKYTLKTETGKTEKRQILISNIEVPGHKFEAPGIFSQKIGGKAQIKIGDPNKTVVGPVHYEIRYRVENAYLFEKKAIRFYWNLKPSDWMTTFRQINFEVVLPQGTQVDESRVFLYSGPVGNNVLSTDFELQITDDRIFGTSNQGVESKFGEAVTLLINLPKESIIEKKPFWPFWTNYGWTLILAMIGGLFYWLFQKYGKDDPAPTVISYFPPENMDPAMVGFLINDREDTSDLISLLPHWGTQGLIEIHEIDKKGWFAKDDTMIRKKGELTSEAPEYQKTVFNGLFKDGNEVLVSSLKNSFYSTMNKAKRELKKEAQRFYEPKSRKVFWYTFAGIFLTFFFMLTVFLYHWGFTAFIVGGVFGITLLILNQFMIKKNPQGIRLYSELKGFKKFIITAEENRIKMLLKESPNYFETTMAFALSFGALDSWADKFDKLDVPPPSWYHTAGGSHSINNFSRSFSNTMRSASTTMVSSPSSSSSGGGSSGGGMGGGGGGSW